MKEVLRREGKVGRESKRKYEATLSYFERLQQRHQILEVERDSLKSSNEALSKEKGSLENKVAELELQKTTAEGKAKHYETQVAALEAQKDSLEFLLKLANEQRTDIESFTKHSLMLRSKIYQMQLQIVDEMLKVWQVESRLEEIVSTTYYFLDMTQDILEILQGRLT